MNGCDAVADALAACGVDTMFSLPGDGNLHMDYAFTERHRVRYVRAVREDGAVMMADGYARASGRLTVASITRGPGLTNTVTALTTAVRHRTPMLLITAEEARNVKHHFQSIDVPALAHVAGAAWIRIDRPNDIGRDIAEAARRAWAERIPVIVIVPMDVQLSPADPQTPVPAVRAPLRDPLGGPASMDAALGMVASARRPLLLAGGGATGAREPLLALARRIGAPVATTVLGKDLFAGDDYNLGIIGTLGTDTAQQYVAAADCTVAFGASLNDRTAQADWVAAGKSVVHCDTDPTALGRYQPISVGVIGDSAGVATTMLELLDAAEVPATANRGEQLAAALAGEADALRSLAATEGMDMRAIMLRLDAVLPAERTLTVDGGRFWTAPTRFLHVPGPQDFGWTLGFGSIGLSFATAIGMATARPEVPAVLVCGDGGFMMSAPELNTAVRYNLDVIAVVLNDGSHGAEYRKLVAEGRDPQITMFDWPDLAGVASALGVDSLVVRDIDADFPAVEKFVDGRRGPILLDVRCDPSTAMGKIALV